MKKATTETAAVPTIAEVTPLPNADQLEAIWATNFPLHKLLLSMRQQECL